MPGARVTCHRALEMRPRFVAASERAQADTDAVQHLSTAGVVAERLEQRERPVEMLQRPGVIAPRPFDDAGGVVQARGGLPIFNGGRSLDRLFVETERIRRGQVASGDAAAPLERLDLPLRVTHSPLKREGALPAGLCVGDVP